MLIWDWWEQKCTRTRRIILGRSNVKAVDSESIRHGGYRMGGRGQRRRQGVVGMLAMLEGAWCTSCVVEFSEEMISYALLRSRYCH
jgi:hypothetical protein